MAKIPAGKAEVEAELNQKPLQTGFRTIGKTVGKLSGGLLAIATGIGAAVAAASAAVLAATKRFADLGDQLDKMAARTGASVEALSAFRFAAIRSGASLTDVENGMKGMAQFMLQAERNSAAAVDTMKDLGLTLEDLQGLAPEDQFRLIAQKIADIPDPTRRAGVAMQALGRSGRALLPMVEDLDALERKAHDLGVTMSGENATAAAELKDAWADMALTAEAVGNSIGASVAPAITDAANAISDALVELAKFEDETGAISDAVSIMAKSVIGVTLQLKALMRWYREGISLQQAFTDVLKEYKMEVLKGMILEDARNKQRENEKNNPPAATPSGPSLAERGLDAAGAGLSGFGAAVGGALEGLDSRLGGALGRTQTNQGVDLAARLGGLGSLPAGIRGMAGILGNLDMTGGPAVPSMSAASSFSASALQQSGFGGKSLERDISDSANHLEQISEAVAKPLEVKLTL
jgi:hypothetical protein